MFFWSCRIFFIYFFLMLGNCEVIFFEIYFKWLFNCCIFFEDIFLLLLLIMCVFYKFFSVRIFLIKVWYLKVEGKWVFLVLYLFLFMFLKILYSVGRFKIKLFFFDIFFWYFWLSNWNILFFFRFVIFLLYNCFMICIRNFI